MTKGSYAFLLFLFIASLSSSCVSKKKYLQSQDRVSELQADSAELANKLLGVNQNLDELQNRSRSTQERLSQELSEKERLLNEKEKMLKQNEQLLNEKDKELYERAKQLGELQRKVEQQNRMVNELKNSIANALVNLKSDEVTLEVKNGKVYVSLAEKLLFNSGSANVDPKGKEALQNLSEVLKKNPDIKIAIEGHTDNVPISGRFQDNWELSTARANSIVRILTAKNGLDPERVTASGHGEYQPVATNDSAEGRARNRRTEIVLSPNLDQLYQMVEETSTTR